MIGRVWHGWTTLANAGAYEALLKTEILPGIVAKNVHGLHRIELFRRDLGDEVEFMTIMWVTSLDAVKIFAGEDYEAAYVPASARSVLSPTRARSTVRSAPRSQRSSDRKWGPASSVGRYGRRAPAGLFCPQRLCGCGGFTAALPGGAGCGTLFSMGNRPPTSGTAKARAQKKKRSARLRAAGFRPVQIWVPDVREPGFAEEVRRQSLRVSRSPGEEDALSFIEAVGDFSDGSDPRKE